MTSKRKTKQLPIVIWKIGSSKRNGLPSKKHFAEFNKFLRKQGAHKMFHSVLVHNLCDVVFVPGVHAAPKVVVKNIKTETK